MWPLYISTYPECQTFTTSSNLQRMALHGAHNLALNVVIYDENRGNRGKLVVIE